jgi:hypothetical protein
MQTHRRAAVIAGIAAALVALAARSQAQGARIKVDLSGLEKYAKSTVNLSIDPKTINWAAQALKGSEKDAAELRDMLQNVTSASVNVLELTEKRPWSEIEAAIGPALRQMKGDGWSPVVSVAEGTGDKRELVNISVYTDPAGKPGGLAIVVAEPGELVVVNVVGAVDLMRLGQLSKALQMPGLLAGIAGEKSTGGVPERGEPGKKDKPKEKNKDREATKPGPVS